MVIFNNHRLQNLLEVLSVTGAHNSTLMSIYCCLDESFSDSSIAPSFRNCPSRRRQFVGMNYFRPCRFGFRSCHIYEAKLFWSNSCHMSCSDWLFMHWEFAIFLRPDFSSTPLNFYLFLFPHSFVWLLTLSTIPLYFQVSSFFFFGQ